MREVGDDAPNFELKDQSGALVTLDKLTEAGDLILYFYPADFTPVCSAEACAFRDNYADMESVGVQVVGVSPQGEGSHARFANAFSIPFPLLADTNKTVIRAYGVNGPMGFGVRRATFLIDRDKVIRNRVVADFFVGSHTDLVKQTLRDRTAT